MRTCRVDTSIVSATARVDEALKHGLLSYSPRDILNDELLARRARLPVRMNGLGIRSQADLLAPAWTGCFVQACESFTDRVNGLGEVVLPGSFPLLGHLFGDGAFNMGGARFESFVSCNTHDLSSARGLREHWAAMRARAAPEAGAAPATGPLSQGVHQAGLQASMSEDSNDHTPSCPRLQHALCDQLEQRQAEMLDEEMRRLPAVQTASMGVIPDPRLASWAEMCAIGRAFVVRHPTRSYAPMSDEFKEMIAIYMGAPSPLAAQIGVGRRVRCPSKGRENLTLDKWGFALLVGQEPRGSTDSWRSHHDAVTHVIYRDTIRAGIEGRTEVRGLFSSLLPPANARRHREDRDGLIPDALLRRPTEVDAMYKDHLHDVKIIHMGSSTYSDTMVKEKGVARCANARANKVNGQYLTKARKLDEECFPSEPDVEARPILRKLRSYPRVRGQCVGAFAECSSDIHLLLREAARCAAIRYWRQVQVGAVSVEAAVAIYSNRYRSHWGAELALQGARLRFSRAYLAAKAPTCQAGMTFGTSSVGFDPADSAQYAAEAAPILGGPPRGQDR